MDELTSAVEDEEPDAIEIGIRPALINFEEGIRKQLMRMSDGDIANYQKMKRMSVEEFLTYFTYWVHRNKPKQSNGLRLRSDNNQVRL